MEILLREARLAVRRSCNRPVFVATAVSLLGLGIGLLLAVASLYDQVVLRKLPVPRPDELILVRKVSVAPTGETQTWPPFSLDECRSLRAAVAAAAELACFARGESVVGSEPDTARVATTWVSPNYFGALGVPLELGPGFPAGDETSSATLPLAVVSYGAWQGRFGGSRDIIGRTILVDGRTTQIVGVAPRGFAGLEVGFSPEVYSLATVARQGRTLFEAFGRMRAKATIPEALSLLRAEHAALVAKRPKGDSWMMVDGKTVARGERIDVEPGARGESELRGTFADGLLMVGLIVLLVALMLSVNLANLLAGRALHERPQNAIRRALGATRGRLAASWLLEAAVLAGLGTLAGIALALMFAPRLFATLPEIAPGATLAFALDGRTASVALLLALGITVTIGGLASWDAARTPLAMTLRASEAVVGSRADGGTWRWSLVAIQIASSVVLLATAGLLVATLSRLFGVDTGIPLDRVLAFDADVQVTHEVPGAALERARNRIMGVPGALKTSYSAETVLSGGQDFLQFAVEGHPSSPGEAFVVDWFSVSPDFFETLSLGLVRGRSLTTADESRKGRVAAVVNQRFVDKYLVGMEPIGHWLSSDIRRQTWTIDRPGDFEIVGVVADQMLASPKEERGPRLYSLIPPDEKTVTFYVRTMQNPLDLASSLRAALRDLPFVTTRDFRNLAEQRRRVLRDEILLGRIAVASATAADLIAAIGLYGVLSLFLAHRGKDYAIRIALGARRMDLVLLIGRRVALVVALGALGGAVASSVVGELLKGFLFRAAPGDATVTGAALLGAGLIALLACWRPIARAVTSDPARALREG